MSFITVNCRNCSEAVLILEEHAKHGAICDACINSQEKPEERIKLAKQQRQEWEAICPELYKDTEIDRLPCPVASAKAMEWEPGQRSANSLGVNLWGFPRTGKTRTMLLLLKREHYAGACVRFFGPAEFGQECELRDFKTAAWLRRMLSYDIVAFDDIDKCKLTQTQEEKFFALLDARLRNFKPMLFTGNTDGEKLETKFRNGEAIVGRIRDCCVSVHFPKQVQLL